MKYSNVTSPGIIISFRQFKVRRLSINTSISVFFCLNICWIASGLYPGGWLWAS